MARCFITGVGLPIEDAWVLDLGPAYRIQREFRQRLASIDRLIEQLAPKDDVQVFNSKTRETVLMKHRRLVSSAVAETLAVTCLRDRLFVKWTVWRARRLQCKDKNNSAKLENSTTITDDGEKGECPIGDKQEI